ncbi:glycosyltransferase [Oceanitalea stevensii]|uniref:glycosyltransferase n=1 Tax=Oceanitalea stevensii TaxID=2763072 RepID=UPI002044DD48|nr:glycosyltransferase family 2 protein [Oceanitalea stevensii]
MTAVPAPVLPGQGEQPDVLVAVVTYNSAEILAPFLHALPAALAGAGTATVVVVDNDSADGTAALARELAPWATVLEAGGNFGYAAGINQALDVTPARRGTYVLNPDAVPSPGSVDVLARAAELDPGIGITVPRIIAEDGSLKPSLRREPTVGRALGEAVLGGRRASRFTALGEMVTDVRSYTDGAEADWATGAAMFLTPRALAAAGRWREDYFLYSEETDYALRVRDAGLSLRLVTGAEVVHPGGDMAVSPQLWSLATVNRTRLYRSRHGRTRSAAFWLAVLLNEGVRALLGRPTHREAARALVLGLRPHPSWPTSVTTG